MDCGYINQRNKKGFGYTSQVTVDTEHGIIIGVDVNSADVRESNIILRHLKKIKENTHLEIKDITLDGGYDIGAVQRGLEILGITGFCSLRGYQNNPMKKGFAYVPEKDAFICEKGKLLTFNRLVFKKSNSNYCRQYKLDRKECKDCPNHSKCIKDYGSCIINASPFYPSFYRNFVRTESSEYPRKMKLRSIWSEGSFSVLKREHKMKRAVKRGIEKVTEECLFSAMALNMKRMVKALA